MPELYIIGGPNGAGKTTTALHLLPSLGCRHFVNADMIARGLSPFDVDAVAMQAGVLLMKRLRTLAATGEDFATESTLSARAYVPLIQKWQAMGYRFNLFYVWLPSAEMAVERVAARVRAGGHSIPQETIRRRYEAGRENFFSLYLPLADRWAVYDNSVWPSRLIAQGEKGVPAEVMDAKVWAILNR